jgi:Tol biopolymer transport system component
MHRWLAVVSTAALLISGSSGSAQTLAHRVSVGPLGSDSDSLSLEPVFSADGRWLAFQSYAGNLVDDDSNGCSDVFLHDRTTGRTTRVSVSSNGVEGDLYSGEPAISADGRFVAFRSDATNLVPGDTNGVADVYVHDRVLGRTYRVSVGPAGAQPNGASRRPSVSGDGRFVAFESEASNLVPDDHNGVQDVFVRDRDELMTIAVSNGGAAEADAESGCASISADGRTVAFASRSSAFAKESEPDSDVFLFDLRSRKITLVSADAAGAPAGGDAPVISRDGSVVVFESAGRLQPGDLNPDRDVYAYRVQTRSLVLASVSSAGAPGRSWTSTPEFGPSSRIAADSTGASVSSDGRYVAFTSLARDLVPGDVTGAEVYVRDLVAGAIRCVTAEIPGAPASSPCSLDLVVGEVECPVVKAQIAGSGLHVAIQTRSAFLATDKNGSDDLYVLDLSAADRSTGVKADRKPEERLSVR